MGLNYGPIVVAREAGVGLRGASIATPGEHTTAYLLGRMFLPPSKLEETAVGEVPRAVRDGAVLAGIVIHEGQLNYAELGLTKLLGLGELWFAETGLPLPLGINVVRRELPDRQQRSLATALRASIDWADANREEAVRYARSFAPQVDAEQIVRFTQMYVNDLTRDMGSRGVAGLEAMYQRAVDAGHLQNTPPLDVLHV